jgi:hypothetical protein
LLFFCNMKHPTQIRGKKLENLVVEISNLRYDALADFLRKLGAKLIVDGGADRKRKRPQLATNLQCAGLRLNQSSADIYQAWRICEPHMPAGKKSSPNKD